MSQQETPPTASQKRAANPDFVQTFSLQALQTRLPFVFPVPKETSPSPKQRYRSTYRYLGYTDLGHLSTLALLTLFEIALRLIDFSPLRDYLAERYYEASTKGQIPFDPVSLFLCVCLRRELRLSWRGLARLLAGEHGVGWRRLFGFQEGCTPTESGLRYFFYTVGPEVFEELCPLFIDLLHQATLLPEHSTFPGDPPERGVTISHDIMLHEAQSVMKCAQVTDTCYQPAPRPCPAQAAGKEGCDCKEEACAQVCRRATPLDQEARYIHYEGNKAAAQSRSPEPFGAEHAEPALSLRAEGRAKGRSGSEGATKGGRSAQPGRDVYGYASNPDRLLDDRFACAWTLRTGLHPANADERALFPQSFAQLLTRFPYLPIGEVLADAALGFQVCLDPIWQAGALRMVDIRAAQGDDDPQVQERRGYNDKGYPLCPHNYVLSPNGHDYDHQRTKWCCEKVCLTKTQPPAPDCPYQAAEKKHGFVVNVGRTLPDGSVRLAREVPYASPAWEARYGRRSLSESRNSSLEGQDLKRLPDFALTKGGKEIAVADFLEGLRTLGRLVQEATTLALKMAAG